MGIAIDGTLTINDDQKGIFQSVQPGQYTDNNRPTTPVAGDIIWNTTQEELQYWDGTKWVRVGGGGGLRYWAGSASAISPNNGSGTFAFMNFENDGTTTIVCSQNTSTSEMAVVNYDEAGAPGLKSTASNLELNIFSTPYEITPLCACTSGDFIYMVFENQAASSRSCVAKFNGLTNTIVWAQDINIQFSTLRATSSGDLIALGGKQNSTLGVTLSKFSATNGSLMWCRSLRGGSSYDAEGSLSIDSDDNAYVFDMNGSAPGVQKIYVGGSGNPTALWGRATPGPYGDYLLASGYGGGLDSAGNVYVNSYPEDGVYGVSPSGQLITKLDNSGNTVWQKRIGRFSGGGGYSFGNPFPVGCPCDNAGNTYCISKCSVTTGGIVHPGGYVTKLNTDGNPVWTRGFFYNQSTTTSITGSSTTTANFYLRRTSCGGDRAGMTFSTSLKNSQTGTERSSVKMGMMSFAPDGYAPPQGGFTDTLAWVDPGATASVSNVTAPFVSSNTFSSYDPRPFGANTRVGTNKFCPDAFFGVQAWPEKP